MFYLADPYTYWLNVTNIGLGVATLILVALVLARAIQERRKG